MINSNSIFFVYTGSSFNSSFKMYEKADLCMSTLYGKKKYLQGWDC